MNFRLRVTILSILLGLFSLTALLGILFSSSGILANRSKPLIRNLNVQAVTTIEVISPESSHTLVRTEDGSTWNYYDAPFLFPSLDANINSFLDAVASVERIRGATSNPELFASLEIEGDRSHQIILSNANQTLYHIYVGKSDDQHIGNYARLAGGDTAYLIGKDLDFYLGQPSSYWQDVVLFSAQRAPEEVIRFSVEADILLEAGEEPLQAQYTLIQQSADSVAGWIEEESEVVLDSARINNLLTSFISLRANSYAPTTLRDTISPAATLEATMNNGAILRLLVGALGDNNQYYITVEGDDQHLNEQGEPYVLRADSWAMRSIIQPLDELLPPPTEAVAQDHDHEDGALSHQHGPDTHTHGP